METNRVVIDSRKLVAEATLVGSILREEPDPVAARAQFRLLLESMFILNNTGPFGGTVLNMIMSQEPHVVVSDPHKLNIVASHVHFTIRDEPDPAAGLAQFNRLLDSFLSANDPDPFEDE
jgi:hypothetical protein